MRPPAPEPTRISEEGTKTLRKLIILAGTCVDILERPELLSEIKTEFRERKQKEKEVSF